MGQSCEGEMIALPIHRINIPKRYQIRNVISKVGQIQDMLKLSIYVEGRQIKCKANQGESQQDEESHNTKNFSFWNVFITSIHNYKEY